MRLFGVSGHSVNGSQCVQRPGPPPGGLNNLFRNCYGLLELILLRTGCSQPEGREHLARINIQGPLVPLRRFVVSPQKTERTALGAAEKRGKGVLTQAPICLSKSFLQK